MKTVYASIHAPVTLKPYQGAEWIQRELERRLNGNSSEYPGVRCRVTVCGYLICAEADWPTIPDTTEYCSQASINLRTYNAMDALYSNLRYVLSSNYN